MDRTGSLKRARVEAPMASLVRHPMPVVRVEDVTPDPNHPPDRRPKKTILDSLRFLVAKKRELAGGKYHEFIAALREFKAGRMDAAGLVTYVKALLAGHLELIHGFSEFLP